MWGEQGRGRSELKGRGREFAHSTGPRTTPFVSAQAEAKKRREELKASDVGRCGSPPELLKR